MPTRKEQTIAAAVFEPLGLTVRPEIGALAMLGASIIVAVNAVPLYGFTSCSQPLAWTPVATAQGAFGERTSPLSGALPLVEFATILCRSQLSR